MFLVLHAFSINTALAPPSDTSCRAGTEVRSGDLVEERVAAASERCDASVPAQPPSFEGAFRWSPRRGPSSPDFFSIGRSTASSSLCPSVWSWVRVLPPSIERALGRGALAELQLLGRRGSNRELTAALRERTSARPGVVGCSEKYLGFFGVLNCG